MKGILRFQFLLVVLAALKICLGVSFLGVTEKSVHSFTVHPGRQRNQLSLLEPRTSVERTNQDLYTANTMQGSHNKFSPTAGQLCFEDKCRCSGTVADCSHNYGRLAYIPRLPPMIRSLVFSFNNLTAVPTDDFFQNVSWIRHLNLSNNGLQRISPGAFIPVKKLAKLSLEYNSLSPHQLQWVFSARNLKNAFLGHMDLTSFPEEILARRSLRGLNYVDLRGNFIEHLDLTVFRHSAS